MHLIFVHGWAYAPDIWQPVIKELDYKIKISCVDLGFFSNLHNHNDFPDDAIYVGHSMGVMWILKNTAPHMKGLISICGFDCFNCHIPKRQILAMQKGLERNPQRQLKMFWTACNTPDYENKNTLNLAELANGLTSLSEWDLRPELTNMTKPRLILAARDDQIVPSEMSCDIWGKDNIHWCASGGHSLPLTQPLWVAEKITAFINELDKK